MNIKRTLTTASITGTLLLTACGGGGGGDDDKAACEALQGAQGQDEGIYDDLRGMDLSDGLRAALDNLEEAGSEITPEVFERGAEVMRLCSEAGVNLSG